MAAVKVSLQGDKEMKARLVNLIREAPKELRKAMLVVATQKLEEIKARTPMKSGKLRGSERVKLLVSGKKEDLRVTILAGGPDAPYARIVHEVHPTQKKFFESVILEAVPTIGAEIGSQFDLKRATQA